MKIKVLENNKEIFLFDTTKQEYEDVELTFNELNEKYTVTSVELKFKDNVKLENINSIFRNGEGIKYIEEQILKVK